MISEADAKRLEEYNNEPVYYCRHCLSLRIKTTCGEDFCDNCNSTDIDSCHISEWQDMMNKRFNKQF